MKLCAKAFGFTSGLLGGLFVFSITLIALYTNYLDGLAEFFVGVYPWYEVTLVGAFIGFVEGFIDIGIGGLIFAWIYNAVVAKCPGDCCKK